MICDRLIGLAFFLVAHKRLPNKNRLLFNDYLFYLKHSTEINNPIRQFVSHKELVKTFYRGIFLEDVSPKTLMRFESFEAFRRSELPDACVIKPAHLSGVIYYDKIKGLSHKELKDIESWFKTNIYYHISRERNYKNLRPIVICEELIDSPETIRDYKIFCLQGVPGAIQVDIDRHKNHRRRLYTTSWSPLDYALNVPLAPIEEKPKLLDKVLNMSASIAKHFSFIRVDFFITDQDIYLGELTNIPGDAHDRFENHIAEKEFMDVLTHACQKNNT